MQISSNPLIWLASASPRRSQLLTQIGVAHRVRPVTVDEGVRGAEPPAAYVERLAAHKAETLWAELSREADAVGSHGTAVLGSDTAVAIEKQILGKPVDEADCLRMLRLLSGRTHQVYTAVALRHARGSQLRLNVSDVTFRALHEEEMTAYWRSGEPADKAGAYAVQGLAALFIERIAGSYSGIMGLPLFETGQLLRTIGWQVGAGLEAGMSARTST